MPERGWEAVTVPGAVAAWVELARRFGTRLLSGRTVAVEPAIAVKTVEAVRARRHGIATGGANWQLGFGGAQLILRAEDGYVAGSDPRKNGQGLAF